jgi:hypothetical protein
MDDDKERRDKPQDDRDEPRTDVVKGGAADVPRAVPSDDDAALDVPTRTPTREPGRAHKGADLLRGTGSRSETNPASPDRHPRSRLVGSQLRRQPRT